MKKLLLINLFAFLMLTSFAQEKKAKVICGTNPVEKSTESEWALADGNWIATDINGVEHNFQDYLDAGKTVIIDFSQTWCGPCWSLHQSGVFDELYNSYGPDGTDELMVFWVESAGASDDLIHGIGSASETQGDWTMDGAFPVPIISSSSIQNSVFYELATGYIPEVIMACPNGYYKHVTEEAWSGADAVYAQLGSCPSESDVPVAEISGPAVAALGATVAFENVGISVATITGYTWTFEGGTPATSTDANPSVSWDAAGIYNVTLVVTNENGPSTEASATISVIDTGDADDLMVTFEEILVDGVFPSVLSPYNWITVDMDSGTVWANFSEFGMTGEGNTFAVYSSATADGNAYAFTPYEGDKCALSMTNNLGVGTGEDNNDWIISPAITLGDDASFEVYVLTVNSNWGLDEYTIAISTTDQSPESFTVLGGERAAPDAWTQVVQDLSDYAGQTVYLAVNYIGGDHYALALDNLKVNNATVGLSTFDNSISVYPNPTTGELRINGVDGANVRVLNTLGQVLLNTKTTSTSSVIDLSELKTGTYIVELSKDGNISNKKIVVTK